MNTEIQAPMPGTIFEIHVQAGDTVFEGQELLVLEAMKMENPILAVKSGKITDVKVRVGDRVAAKQVLMALE